MGTQMDLGSRKRPMVKWRASIALVSILAGLILTPATALAQDDSGRDFVDVVEVNGLIDPVLAELHRAQPRQCRRRRGQRGRAPDGERGGGVGRRSARRTRRGHRGYELPISAWLGQANNGAAFGGAGRVARATDRIGISPGSELELESGERIGYDELILSEPGAFPFEVQDAPAVLNHLLELNEFDFAVYQIGDTLPNGAVVEGAPTRWPLTDTRFVTLPLIDQQFHTFASPAVAYLLFVIGLGLLVFELFTAGIGVAGVIGAGSLLAGGYGLAVLDARPFAVAFLVIAFIGFAIDVQSGIQQFWSAVGVVGLLVGSVYLLDDYSIGWLPLLVGIVGVLMAMLGGMPAMVRTRFSTPTIGREWMIGSVGSVVEAVDPDGVVSIDGAPWRARTNRATPISVGEEARVVEVDGLLLEVAPLEGAAIDYRERRRSES